MSQQKTSSSSTTHWHCLPPATVLENLASSQDGLSAEQARIRLQEHGPNELQQTVEQGPFKILLSQFQDFMILVLVAAAVLAGLTGDLADALTILAILVLNAAIGFMQELRARKAMHTLGKLAAPVATVKRDGRITTIPAIQLVPGDIVLLEAGNLVPADLRLLDLAGLQMDEAALTGESQPVSKTLAALQDPQAAVADRSNIAFKGTLTVKGRGAGIVIASGMDTELGNIARLLSSAEDTRTPLQRRLSHFSKQLSLVILLICAIIFISGLLRNEPLVLMLLTSVSLAVAAIPESLPAVVTVALALGAFRLVKQQALIRHLNSVETLGSITWICSDKTGTLTENRMRVESLWLHQQQVNAKAADNSAETLFTAMLLCNDARAAGTEIEGDPTETALFAAARSFGLDQQSLKQRLPRIDELPFESERMCMTTLHQDQDGIIGFTKGAPEAVLACCTAFSGSDSPESINKQVSAMAAEGMRVLAFARRRWDVLPDHAQAETGLEFVGLVGLIDPPRAEAAAAIAACKTAGITAVMITGDHPATAQAIARRLNLLDDSTQMLTGKQLSALSDTELQACVTSIRVYARMDPAQKIRIVKALQAQGEYVAMTGDGVNDAPALRQADIGVAMGCIGTDVAREAADLILLDDNFATIVTAIGRGRQIYDNIRRFIRYILTTNLAEVLLIFLAPLCGLPLPLLPIHILWVNLVTDGLPGLALTLEKSEPDLMQRPPRPPRESLFAQKLWLKVLWTGILMAALILLTQAFALHYLHYQMAHWQTLVFTSLTFTQLGNVLVIRSDRESLFRMGFFSNRYLNYSLLLTLTLQMCLLYVPWLNGIFSTQPLSLLELLYCFAVAGFVMVAVEVEKLLLRSGVFTATAKVTG